MLAPLPGLDLLASIVEPPLQVIIALLKVVAALLEALSAILIGITDLFRALIMAAYELVRDIINDLLNTGAYMYIDAPGIMPTEVGIRETGIFVDPVADWKAGRAGQSPPIVPDGFTRWASRFAASFDDPGDLKRPVITEGAPIQAVFVVMAAPSLESLRQLIYLLGRLFNIDKFKLAFEKYELAERRSAAHASAQDQGRAAGLARRPLARPLPGARGALDDPRGAEEPALGRRQPRGLDQEPRRGHAGEGEPPLADRRRDSRRSSICSTR